VGDATPTSSARFDLVFANPEADENARVGSYGATCYPRSYT
jgi:hypothetical protein